MLRSLGNTPECSPEVLRSENNIVFGLDSTTVAKASESDRSDALIREAGVISALAGNADAPVVRPSRLGLGPFEVDGWMLILLERLSDLPARHSPTAVTRSLADLHFALASISIELPIWTDHIERTTRAWRDHPFDSAGESTAESAYVRFVRPALLRSGSTQILHGDAWSGQMISTPEGMRWIDFESACVGPREWDLAGFDDLSDYGGFDRNLWQQLRLVRSWSVAVWCNVNKVHSPQLTIHTKQHLERLDEALRTD